MVIKKKIKKSRMLKRLLDSMCVNKRLVRGISTQPDPYPDLDSSLFLVQVER